MTSLYRRFGRALLIAAAVAAIGSTAAFADVPTDIVPRDSGAYDALAVLARGNLLPGGMDAATFVGNTARLQTRAEMLAMVDSLETNSDKSQFTPNELAAVDFLAAYLDDTQAGDHAPHWTNSNGYAGSITGEVGSQKQSGKKAQAYEDALGEMHLFGIAGSNAYYSVGGSNIFSQREQYDSFNTRYGGTTPDDDIRQRSGLGEAYVAFRTSHGIVLNVGVKSRRWGPGYSGDMLISDNAAARPGIELDVPLWLGHKLGLYRFSQVQEEYRNVGKTIYVGFRRLEHPFPGRLDLDLQESYAANKLRNPLVLFLPYYSYQKQAIHPNSLEPTEFNYNVMGGLTYTTDASAGGMVYAQFFIDDIQSPKGIGMGNHVPRKIGYLIGANQPLSTSTHVVAEYIRTDPQAYTKPDPTAGPPELAWFEEDLPLAHRVGPNAQAVYARINQKLGGPIDVSVAGLIRRRISDSFPAPNDGMLTAAISYHASLSQSISVRYADFREDAYTGGAVFSQVPGGVDYGVTTRQKLVSVDYMVAF